MIELRTSSPDETLAVGRRLAAQLRAGDVILLTGALGCGKTCLAGGIAEGLGVDEPVVSPSFIIMRPYLSGFLPLFHADVYRLTSMAEFDDLELPDLARDGVLIVEWGGAVEAGIPEDHLEIAITIDDDGDRTFRFVPHGDWAKRSLEAVA